VQTSTQKKARFSNTECPVLLEALDQTINVLKNPKIFFFLDLDRNDE